MGGTLNVLQKGTPEPYMSFGEVGQMRALFKALGGIRIKGLLGTGNAGALTINIGAGVVSRIGGAVFLNQNNTWQIPTPVLSAPTIVAKYANTSSTTTNYTVTQFIDPSVYATGGAITAVPGSDPWSVWKVTLAAQTAPGPVVTTDVIAFVPEEIFKTQAEAQTAALTNSIKWTEGQDTEVAAPAFYIVVERTMTSLLSALFIPMPDRRGTGGSNSVGSAGYSELQEAGTPLTGRDSINYPIDAKLEDDAGNNRTDVFKRNPTFSYTYSSTTTAADPGAGFYRLNNTPNLATQLYINTGTEDFDLNSVIGALILNDQILIKENNSNLGHVLATITGTPTNNTGWYTIPINTTSVGNNDSLDLSPHFMSFMMFGARGAGGAAYDTFEMQFSTSSNINGTPTEIPTAFTKMMPKGYSSVSLVGIRGYCDDIAASFAGDCDISVYRRTPDNVAARGIGDGTLVTTQQIRTTGVAVTTTFDGDLTKNLLSSPVDFTAAIGQVLYLDVSTIDGWFLTKPSFTLILRGTP